MKSVTLKAYPRSAKRRNALRPLRDSGRIPAVIYGAGEKSQSLEVDSKALDTALHHHLSETLLVDLNVENDVRPQRLALVQEVQHHPLSRTVLHVDFHEVSATERVTISVPVETSGEAVGVKTGGGVIEHVLHKVKVHALPKDLPEAIIVDVSTLDVDRSIHLGELPLPVGVEVIGNKDLVVIACTPPKTEEQAVAEEAPVEAASAEVEMIKEKKEEDGAKSPAKEGEKKK